MLPRHCHVTDTSRTHLPPYAWDHSAVIDLTNPDARAWIKEVIKNNLIAHAGSSGWMADFGELVRP